MASESDFHQALTQRFSVVHRTGRWANGYLFVGPPGVGKRTFALRLAKALLCQEIDRAELAPCSRCASCRLFTADGHPDLVRVKKPEDRSTLAVELLIGPPENRMKEGFCSELGSKPRVALRKAAILEDADYLAEEGANALLKTLEEPPQGAVIILIGTSEQRQLPTIRSRCQVVRFSALSDEQVSQVLVELGVVDSVEIARTLAARACGSVAHALMLADAELMKFSDEFGERILKSSDGGGIAQFLHDFVEGAGSEASEKRVRVRAAMDRALDVFRRELIREVEDSAVHSVESITRLDSLVQGIERTMAALGQVDRNAHVPTLIDCWIDDVLQIRMGKGGAFWEPA